MISTLTDAVSNRMTPGQLAAAYRHTPMPVARAISLAAFRRTVRWAGKHSAFYREQFAARKIDPKKVRRPEDLGDFFTTPDDLVRRPNDFLCRPPNIVFESSGTSGTNKRVYYSEREMRAMGRTTAAGLKLMGVNATDRVANGFDFSIWIPGWIWHYGLMAHGCFHLAFGKVDPVEVYRRLDTHNFNVVAGEPTWLIRLTELAEKDGGRPLKLLIGGAEEMPAAAIDWMKKVWRGADVRMCYGSVEQGSGIGFQPCHQAGGYHIDTVDFLPELIEPDADGYGEMVFTTLRRDTMPLIRYRTRDVTRLHADRCGCGLRQPRIERIRGRRDELVVASGGNLYPKMFENVLRPVSGLTHDWQVVFTLDGVREVLSIHVETDRTDTAELEKEVFAQAADQYPDLIKNLNLGIFKMQVVPHRPGEVRKARKLKRLIDRRHFDTAETPTP